MKFGNISPEPKNDVDQGEIGDLWKLQTADEKYCLAFLQSFLKGSLLCKYH